MLKHGYYFALYLPSPVGTGLTETPANPTNSLVDLRLMREASEWLGREQGEPRPPVTVDNTFLGPVFQRPIDKAA